MKYIPIQQLEKFANVGLAGAWGHTLSRRARLERWAKILERLPNRRLNALPDIEWMPRADSAQLRVDDSPLTVAYEDSVLREAGLKSDRFGDALTFFQLSERRAHAILCSCNWGGTVQADAVAQAVRTAASVGALMRSSVAAALLVAAPLLAALLI